MSSVLLVLNRSGWVCEGVLKRMEWVRIVSKIISFIGKQRIFFLCVAIFETSI